MTTDDRCAEQGLDSSPHFNQTSYLCKQVFNSALTHPHISCYVNMHVRAALLATSVLSLATLAQHEFMYNMTDINFIPIHISNFWYEDLTRCLCVYVYKRYTLCINVYFLCDYIYMYNCVCVCGQQWAICLPLLALIVLQWSHTSFYFDFCYRYAFQLASKIIVHALHAYISAALNNCMNESTVLCFIF